MITPSQSCCCCSLDCLDLERLEVVVEEATPAPQVEPVDSLLEWDHCSNWSSEMINMLTRCRTKAKTTK